MIDASRRVGLLRHDKGDSRVQTIYVLAVQIEHLAEHGVPVVSQLPTPAMVVDASVVKSNLGRLAEYAGAHGLRVRPHTKTHKSRRLAELQLAMGACGLTVAKAGEAQIMAEVTDDLLIAYPMVDPARNLSLATLAHRATVRIAIDSVEAAEALEQAAQHAGATLDILIDLDVGMGRTGVQSGTAALELAQLVDRFPRLRLTGLFCYPGHVWQRPDDQGPFLRAIADALQEALDLWKRHGLQAAIVSGGSTPTAYQSHLMPQLTEIRPGTYIFNDMNTVRGGFCAIEQCAARIVCTVVSNAVPGKVVLDAGTKTLTSDRCIPFPESGHGYIVQYPEARIVRLSEEHGEVDITGCDAVPKIGERVTVIPNHICPCVNLQDDLWLLHDDGGIEQLPVDARGKSC